MPLYGDGAALWAARYGNGFFCAANSARFGTSAICPGWLAAAVLVAQSCRRRYISVPLPAEGRVAASNPLPPDCRYARA
jgi:hypothetical protein